MNQPRYISSGSRHISVILCLAGMVSLPAQGQRPDLPTDSNALRIEWEAKLLVPLDEMEAVWTWLEQRYRDTSWLNSDAQQFTAAFGNEDFSDTYFDTPELELLHDLSGIRHRIRTIRSGPSMDKDGRELVQLKVNRRDETGLARSEIKFVVTNKPEFKSNDDTHPLLRLIKGKDRPDFKAEANLIGINPYELRPVLTLKQNRRRVYLADQMGAFATLTLDDCATTSWGTDVRWVEIELELSEIRYTEADMPGRAAMEAVIDAIQRDMEQAFPSLAADVTPKYNKAFAAIEEESWLPVRRLHQWKMRPDEFIAWMAIGLLAIAAGLYTAIRSKAR